MIRALLLAPLLAGCFDFSQLSECNGTTAMVCDGFEHGIDANVWLATPPAGLSGGIDGVRAHSGSKAFHVSGVPATSNKYFLQWHGVPVDPALQVYTRAFVYVPVTSPNNVALTTMVEQGGPTQVRTVLTPTSLELFNGFTSTSADSPAALPVGRWTCIEWEVDEGTTAINGGMALWIDDVQVATQPGPTIMSSPLDLVSIGAAYINPPTANDMFDIWFDDVVIDTQRITCRQ